MGGFVWGVGGGGTFHPTSSEPIYLWGSFLRWAVYCPASVKGMLCVCTISMESWLYRGDSHIFEVHINWYSAVNWPG